MDRGTFLPSSSTNASASSTAVGSSTHARSNGTHPTNSFVPFSGGHRAAGHHSNNPNGAGAVVNWGAAFAAAAAATAANGSAIDRHRLSNLMMISSGTTPPTHSGGDAAEAAASISALTTAAASTTTNSLLASALMSSAASGSGATNSNNNITDLDACRRCGATGCDVRLEHSHAGEPEEQGVGCYLHARCCPPPEQGPESACPVCREPLKCVRLLPMAFDEIDQARLRQQQEKDSDKKGGGRKKPPPQSPPAGKDAGDDPDGDDDNDKNWNRKRKASTVSASDPDPAAAGAALAPSPAPGESPDLRTGRWTPEETAYCDHLIHLFEVGQLPIPDGLKLNDFLSGMLKSKQARLTKKMKNAKLSSRQYRRVAGFITDREEAVRFSLLESSFLQSLRCDVERSELRFHTQKEWRELFSTYCVNSGIKLDAGLWLSSVEEMDRRASRLKDAARMQRRKEMMGYALSEDHQNPQRGVFIDPHTHPALGGGGSGGGPAGGSTVVGGLPLSIHHPQQQPSEAVPDNEASERRKKLPRTASSASLHSTKPRPLASYSSPFIGKVIHFLQRRNMPFEHVDAWVPSLVPTSDVAVGAGAPPSAQRDPSSNVITRLCFAGCGTTEVRVPENGAGPAQHMSVDDQFDLISFGLYSQKFSFDVGCGLPGRVYQSGIPSWEQGIANAPTNLFERASGARQWGIQTVLGLPVFSPNVGRIVVLFYSCFDRPREDQVVARIIDELTKMLPSPQWKLVVDVGLPPEPAALEEETTESHGARVLRRELLSLIQFHTPADKSSPLAEFLPGFSSLRLLLSSDKSESDRERGLLKAALGYFQSYRAAGVSDKDAVWMTARDFMTISKHTPSGLPTEISTAKGPPLHVAHYSAGSVTSRALVAQTSSVARSSGALHVEGSCSSRVPVSPAEQHSSSTQQATQNQAGLSVDSERLSSTLSLLQSAQAQSQSSVQGEGGHLLTAGGVADMALGLSPALHPIGAGDLNLDTMSNLALGLSANQLAAFLQSDSFHFNDTSGLQ